MPSSLNIRQLYDSINYLKHQIFKNDIDFIINQIQENMNNENENKNNNNSSEFEKCLINKINECLSNEKFNELPISIIYRIIKSNSAHELNNVENNLLYDFIENKKEERYILYKFVDVSQLNNDKFDELYENYINDQKSKSESTNIKYYEYYSPKETTITDSAAFCIVGECLSTVFIG